MARRPRQAIIVLCSMAVLFAWCGWVSGFHRGTRAALTTWVVSLAAVVAVNLLLWRGRHGRRPGWRLTSAAQPWPPPSAAGDHPAVLGTLPWLALALVALAWDVLGLDTGVHQSHLTISALSQAYRSLNAALLLVWMLAGVAYGIARARTPSGAGAHWEVASFVVPPALLLPSDPSVGVAFWLGLAVAAVALDAIARRTRGRIADAEDLLRHITRAPAANALVVLLWAYAGYHLFAF